MISRSSALLLGTAILLGASALPASAQQFRPAIDPPVGFVPRGPSGFPPLTVPPPPPGWMGSGSAPTGGPGFVPPRPAYTFLEWNEGPNRDQITVRISPNLRDQLWAKGLAATAGTVTSSPVILGGSPGPGVLVLGGQRFQYVQTNGYGSQGNRTVFVVILRRQSTAAGIWTGPVRHSTGFNETYATQIVKHANGTLTGTDGFLAGGNYQAVLPILNGRWQGDTVSWKLSRDGGFQYDIVQGRLTNGVLVLNITTYERMGASTTWRVLATSTATLQQR